MKMTPQLLRAQANMQPGVITSAGFLGDDTRAVADIIAADEERLQALGIDPRQAVERLEHLLREGRRGLGEPITVEGRWLVQVSEARGSLACPWEDGIFGKINAVVENTANNSRLLVSELSLHLMSAHRFLQGRGSSFRIEPKLLRDVLEET